MLLRKLPAPFIHVGPMTFFRDQDSITWATFFRSAIGLSADMSIVAWGFAFVGSSIKGPTWLIYAMAVGLMSTGGFLYLLLLKEFWGLIGSYRRGWRQAVASICCGVSLMVIGSIPAIYGLSTGVQHQTTKQPSCAAAQKEGSR